MKYRLKKGKKYHLEGQRLEAGAEVELTENQAKAFSDMFEPVAEATFRTMPAKADPKSLSLADLSWEKAAALVAKLDTTDALDRAEAEEKAGKDRKGVYDAIETRRAGLGGKS